MSKAKRKSTRDHKLEILCTTYEESIFKRAAEARGMTLSAWVRDVLRLASVRERAAMVSARQESLLEGIRQSVKELERK